MSAITIEVNGERRTVEPSTVRGLLDALGHPAELGGIAVAVNDRVVPRGSWADRRLEDGDRVEIVGAVQGG